MAYIVTLENFTPVPRFDATPFTEAQIERSGTGPNGPWVTVATVTLSPVDADPSQPQARNFSVSADDPTGWYRVVWLDAASNRSESGAIYDDQSSYQAAGISFGTLVSRYIAITGATPAEAKQRLNQAHRRMVIESEILKARVTIGQTEVGKNIYELDPDIVQLLSLRVNGYGQELEPTDDIDDLNANDAYIVGRTRGYFAAEYSPAGAGELLIYPTPNQQGQAITGRAIMAPPDLVNDTDYPSLPVDFHEDLIDGAMADAFRRDDERLSEADALEARFMGRIKALRGRGMRRVGSGNARIRLRV